MKYITLTFLVVIIVTACTPSEQSIQTAIAQTQIADEKAISQTQSAYTPTPKPTNTPAATNTPRPTKTKAPPTWTPRPQFGELENPYPLQRIANLTLTISGVTSQFDFTVLEVIRGEEANKIVKRANMFNDDPPEGMEYALIKVKVLLNKGKLELNRYDITVLTNGQLFDEYSSSFSVCCTEDEGYPDFEANLVLPGATTEGWIIRPVFINDLNPLVALGVGLDNDISNALFFSTAQ